MDVGGLYIPIRQPVPVEIYRLPGGMAKLPTMVLALE
jgi:hypothetical protein